MQLLICDLDGTLTQTAKIDEACFSMALKQEFDIRDFNRDWSSYSLRTDWGQGRQILEQAFNRAPRADELHRLHYRFLSLLEQAQCSNPEYFQAVPGALEMIADLQQQPDWKTAVVSAGWQTSSRLKLRWAGFDLKNLPLYCPRDRCPQNPEGQGKSRLISEVIRDFQFSENDTVVYLADNEWDMQFARENDCRFVVYGSCELGKKLMAAGADGLLCDYRDKRAINTLLHRLTLKSAEPSGQ